MTNNFNRRQEHSLSRVAHRLAGHYGHEWGGLPYGHAAVAWRAAGEQGVALATALMSTDTETGESIGFSGIDCPSVDEDGRTYRHTTGTGRTSWCGIGDYPGDWECVIRRPGGAVLTVNGSGYITAGDPSRIEWRHIEAARYWLEGVQNAQVSPGDVLDMLRQGPVDCDARERSEWGDQWTKCADRCAEELKELLNEQAQCERERLEEARQRSIESYNAEPTEAEEEA